MQLGETLYVTTRRQWRAWLKKHHATAREVWLVYYRKSSGKPRITYDDAVREALCFGWIDSTAKGIDGEAFAQRFTPRKPTSMFSQMNRERVRELIAEGAMTPAGLKAIAHAFNPKRDNPKDFKIPAGILRALKANKDAWRHFQKFPASYQRIRVAYIEAYRESRPETYRRSLDYFIRMTAKGKRIGTW